jgi:hypothetical protein
MITQVEGSVQETMLVSRSEIFHRLNHDEIMQAPGSHIIRQGALVNAKVAMQEVVIMNQPKNFVLEIAPIKTKHTAKSGKIVRSGDRPIYMILPPKEIRKRMSLPDPPDADGENGRPSRKTSPHTHLSKCPLRQHAGKTSGHPGYLGREVGGRHWEEGL